jgi:hypothetical protein
VQVLDLLCSCLRAAVALAHAGRDDPHGSLMHHGWMKLQQTYNSSITSSSSLWIWV